MFSFSSYSSFNRDRVSGDSVSRFFCLSGDWDLSESEYRKKNCKGVPSGILHFYGIFRILTLQHGPTFLIIFSFIFHVPWTRHVLEIWTLYDAEIQIFSGMGSGVRGGEIWISVLGTWTGNVFCAWISSWKVILNMNEA